MNAIHQPTNAADVPTTGDVPASKFIVMHDGVVKQTDPESVSGFVAETVAAELTGGSDAIVASFSALLSAISADPAAAAILSPILQEIVTAATPQLRFDLTNSSQYIGQVI